MDAKHRMPEVPEQRRSLTDDGERRSISGIAAACEVISGSLLCAASVMALVLNGPQPEKRTVASTQEPPPAAQSVSQEGTVIAVTAGSVTARSANGYTQTYLVTPNTTVITHNGSQPASSATHFTVNDRIVVVGRIQGGRALATTVADRDAGSGDAPPMDYLDAQPVSSGTT